MDESTTLQSLLSKMSKVDGSVTEEIHRSWCMK